MRISEKLVWHLYTGLLGAVTTIVAQKALVQAWRLATGETPPDPNDPDVPFAEAVTWAIAAGVGVGVSQLTLNRYMTRTWQRRMSSAPGALKNRLATDRG